MPRRTPGNRLQLSVKSVKIESAPKSPEKQAWTPVEGGTVTDLDGLGPELGEGEGRGPLHLAAMTGQLKNLEFLISDGADVNEKDGAGNTPLHLAMEANEVGSVGLLLSSGADSSLLNDRSLGAIHVAVTLNRIDALKELLKSRNVDPNLDGEDGATPLHYCAWFDRPECARILLDNKASTRRQCDVGLYPLNVAVHRDSKATLQVLIEYAEKMGLPVHECLEKISEKRTTPLHAAIRGGDLKSVKTFLSYGLAIDAVQDDGSTAVHLAAERGSTDVIQLMFDTQPDKKVTCLQSRDALGMTPLHRAALMDRNRTVEYLLEHGSEIDAITTDGRTPLLLAAERRAWATMGTLIDAGADVGLRDPDNRNIVHLTIRSGGRLEKLERFLRKESQRQLLDEQDSFGCTPLHYACSQGHLNTVVNLLLLGSNPCTKTDRKQSALHFAARIGNYETCQLLMEYTPLVSNLIDEIDAQGQTPLHVAAEEGHARIVKLFLKRGAIAVKDINGDTPLHLAAKNGFVDTIAAILEIHGALLDNLNTDHDSCLHLAAREGHAGAVTLLLTRDCKLNLNKDDLYAMDLAIKNMRQETCSAFISHERWKEALECRSKPYGCPMIGLIKHMPEVCQMVLDRSKIPSGPDPKAAGFHYIYDFKYLQMKHEVLWNLRKNGFNVLPLFTMNMMVRFNRVECLCHPVCTRFLNMKWETYGRWCHLTNLFFYFVFVFSLSGFILTQHCPVGPQDRELLPNNHSNASVDITPTCTSGVTPKSTWWYVLLILVLSIACINIIKIVVQLVHETFCYFADIGNILQCIMYVSSGIFAGTFLFQQQFYYQWTCGTVAIFLAWFNLLLFLQRFDYFGIHIVMFLEILKTLVKVITVFFVLIIAFGFVFMILQANGNSVGFASPFLSLMSTGLMMLGAIDYIDTWVNPFSRGELPDPFLNFLMLVVFILFMPILLINLLIGLAVGDIDSVRKNACLKRLAMQVQLYTELEESLPRRLLKLVDKPLVKVYPGICRDTIWQKIRKTFMKKDIFTDEADIEYKTNDEPSTNDSACVHKELCKQKTRMKQISGVLERQQRMLRLLLRKMEIEEDEADDEDGDSTPPPAADDSAEVKGQEEEEESTRTGSCGWSSRLLRHTLVKQAMVIAKWKQPTAMTTTTNDLTDVS